MSIKHGRNIKLITSDWINAITLTGCNIITQGNTGINGGYEIYVSHDGPGCGSGPGAGFSVELKDLFPWSNITFQWLGNGNAACWNFNITGYGGTGNSYLAAYDESKGDKFHRCYLTWNMPEYITHDKFSACDNNADNFFRFNSGLYKSFYMTRRRDTSGHAVILNHGRSCNSVGSISILRNIIVW